MLVLDRASGACEIRPFGAIREYLSAGDALIYNDTRVLRGRMYARKNGDPAGAKFELLLVQALDPERRKWNALLKPGKRALPGVSAVLLDGGGALNAAGDRFTVLGRNDDGSFIIEFNTADSDRAADAVRPYSAAALHHARRRDRRRRTVPDRLCRQGRRGGRADGRAPFHAEILSELAAAGVREGAVTLHVGPGTIQAGVGRNAEEHKMHSEEYFLTPETAELVNSAHAAGKRVLAVGTTTVRTLESCAEPDGTVRAGHGNTQIFLYPPYRVRSVDLLLTNFHLPKSTLLMLVSCFCDREKVLAAYELAIRERMRFYSYGDCMLLK